MNYKSPVLAYCLAFTMIFSGISTATTPANDGNSHLVTASAASIEQEDLARASEALRQGRMLLQRGKASEALGFLETALKLFSQANVARGQAAAHNTLGDLYERQGQYNVALTHYQNAHQAFSEAERKEGGLAKAVGIADNAFNANLMLAKIGTIYYQLGKISEASSAFGRMNVTKPDTGALAVAKGAESKVNKGRGLGSRLRGIALGTPSISSAESATSTVKDAASLVKEGFDLYRQLIIYTTHELGLGRVDYYNNQLESAKKHFEEALAAAGGNIPVIGKLGQTRRFRVAARTSLGDIALRQSRYKDAIKLYNDAANGAREDKRPDLMWPAQRGIGRAYWLMAAQEKDSKNAAKSKENAIASYREALKTIEMLRQGSLRADESRTTFLATTKDVFDEASSALAEMALSSASSTGAPLEGQALNYAAESFKIAEQGRARSLLDLLSETGASITEGVPAELLKRKQENLERQQEIAQQLTGVSLTGEAPTQSVEKLEEELEQLATEYDSLENQIRTASPRYAALTATQPLTLAEVQQQVLDDKTALLEYSLGKDQSYLWAITQNSASLYKLPPRNVLESQVAELRDQIVPQSLRRSIVSLSGQEAQRGLAGDRGLGVSTTQTGGAPSAFATAAHTLYKTVVEPAASVIGDKRLLIVADGALSYVPFEALVTAPGGTDFAALPYLIKSHEMVYAPSASVIAALRQQKTASGATPGRGVLLVADPVFDTKDPRARANTQAGASSDAEAERNLTLSLGSAVTDVSGKPSGSSASEGLKLVRLNGTRDEAQQIAQLARTAGMQADVWLDFDANETNIKTRDIGQYRVLHVATHGLLNTERPQFTGVALSLVGNRGDDGFLRTDEIFNLRLGAPIVMLSACETGLGKEKRGEGVIGLTRAFMYAGAPTVGVSLWSVSDKSTADLMTDFYKRLLAKPGTSPATALRDAQQAMISVKRYSAPFYWAPFVLIGDWR